MNMMMAASTSLSSSPKPSSPTPISRSPRPTLRSFFSRHPLAPLTSSLSGATLLKPPRTPRPLYIPNRIPDPIYVRVFDTTLRDGEQSPGATMTSAEKLLIARQLSILGVDVIEAGFPASSPDDLDAVRSIAIEVGNNPMREDGHIPVICGLSRCNKRDIDAAWEAVKHAKRPRIHTFIATSDIHMQHKLRKTKEEVVAIAREMVAYARSLGCPDVEFSPEDASRSDREFLYHILEEVIKAGATALNIPDTVGYYLPGEFSNLIADIKKNTKGIENVIISTHCQNDLDLATANTLGGVSAGACQEVTINGIGERAGNASLEEVVSTINCRQDEMGGVYTGINTQQIMMCSKMVQEHSGSIVQPHKAIVGANAFAHESGIHQDGMLKHKGTYEIISPEDIGLYRSIEYGIVLGKLRGRHAVKNRLIELGYVINDKEIEDFFKRYKEVAEKKKRVTDEDIKALLFNEIFQLKVIWSFGEIQEVIKAGATTLNIPDTVGYNLPGEFTNLIADIKKNKGIDNVIISMHCQNDLGLATANALGGVSAGAHQVEVTINGIGEIAGNASLEEMSPDPDQAGEGKDGGVAEKGGTDGAKKVGDGGKGTDGGKSGGGRGERKVERSGGKSTGPEAEGSGKVAPKPKGLEKWMFELSKIQKLVNVVIATVNDVIATVNVVVAIILFILACKSFGKPGEEEKIARITNVMSSYADLVQKTNLVQKANNTK